MLRRRNYLVFNTLIGEGTTVHSHIQSPGSVRIDGVVYGDITSEKDIYLSKNSRVTGNLKGRNVYIAGHLEGSTDSTSVVRLFSTGNIVGDIRGQKIITDEGARFAGSFKTHP